MAVIVLEGPEGSGKTTLADMLCEIGRDLGYVMRYEHHAYGDSRSLTIEGEVARIINDHAVDPKRVYVYDRWWLSEYVYGAWDKNRIMTIDYSIDVAHNRYQRPIISARIPSLWILLDAEDQTLAKNRTPDDYPIPIPTERKMYRSLANMYWTRSNWPHDEVIDLALAVIFDHAA